MSNLSDPPKTGVWSRDPKKMREPNYKLVVEGLSDAELEDEILLGKGAAEFQAALLVEAERRASLGPPS